MDKLDQSEYRPEPGSALAEMKKIAEMEQFEPDEAELRKLDPYGPDFEKWVEEERVRDEIIQGVHEERRVSNPKYHDMDASSVSNIAWEYKEARQKAGDKRLDSIIKSSFYETVYPDYKPYFEKRMQQKPDFSKDRYKAHSEDSFVAQVLEEFLKGEDLKITS